METTFTLTAGGRKPVLSPSFSWESPLCHRTLSHHCFLLRQQELIALPGDSPQKGPSKKSLLTGREVRLSLPPTGFPGTETATMDNKEWGGRPPEWAGRAPTPTRAARLASLDLTCTWQPAWQCELLVNWAAPETL